MAEKGVTSRSEDYSKWYTDVVQKTELADYSPVKGCMVIRPYGYALWENMQARSTAASRPPATRTPTSRCSSRELSPEGSRARRGLFARAGRGDARRRQGARRAAGRPAHFRDDHRPLVREWIQSYRDLPILINQWANVVRWELRTRLFLRTTEFLWQEGHTAHATREEAEEETRRCWTSTPSSP